MENQLSATDVMPAYGVQNQMVKAGFSKLAVALSLRLLENRGFMESAEDRDNEGDTYWQYRVTSPALTGYFRIKTSSICVAAPIRRVPLYAQQKPRELRTMMF